MPSSLASRTRPIPSSTSYSAPSSLETRSHRSFYCRCVRSPAHERQTTSYAYAGLTCCPTQRDGCSRSSKTRPLMSSRPSQTSYTRRTLGDGHRSWTTALETGIARRRCLFKFKFIWSAGNRRAPRCDRPTDRNYARSSPTSRSASRSLSLENSTTLAVTTLAHQHRIEARPGVLLVPREIRRRGRAVQRLARVFTPQGPSGKLGVLTLHSAPAVSITIERRLYVTDRTHKIRFLIDSGSVLSILPRTVVRKPLQRKTLELQAANGTTIATYGQHSLTLNLGLRGRPFEWAFTIARVDVAIIGADLLSHFGLLIDLRNRRLLDNQTSLSTSCQVGPAPRYTRSV
ncbi:unnamed protein product [Trichogramma brassicae]|uniref:Peptidase A2 domain-containing protein n=1 Tax=Trichogramma brassicae TaxID=86971 RepID=A0A6H5I3U6_9HYME|nr:unnamed protein product [Trichogramma brassicae]